MPTEDDLTTAGHGSHYRPRPHYPLLRESCANRQALIKWHRKLWWLQTLQALDFSNLCVPRLGWLARTPHTNSIISDQFACLE
jgi:hypothetical protein